MAGASTTSSLISLVKTIIGAGLMSMPFAFATDGIAVGVLIILLAGLTSGYGLFLQAYVSKYVPQGHATFFNLCSATYPSLSVVFDLAIAVQCFGCALSYLVLIGDLMPLVVASVPYVDSLHLRIFWIFALAVLCVPLSFLKNLDSLKYTSVLALCGIAYLSVMVIAEYVSGSVPADLRGPVKLVPVSLKAVCSTFSIIVFAFTGHQNMFSIINEAENKSLRSLSRLVYFAILLTLLLFISVGITGYLTFGDYVSGNIITLYPRSTATQVARFAIVFLMVCLFPLMLHPARISVNNIYYWVRKNMFGGSNLFESETLLGEEDAPEISRQRQYVVPFSHTTFCVITGGLLLLAYGLAVSINSFALVLAVVGATGSTAISFILPGLFGYSLVGSEVDVPSTGEKILKACSLCLVVWGFVVMVVCLYSSLAI